MARKSAGAPKREDKRAAIMDAATKVFLEVGYARASMDRVSREANVSKATVYNHFEGKQGLFGAIVEAECEKLTSVLPGALSNGELAQTLTELGTRFLDLAMSAQNLSLYRLVVAEVAQFPELGQQFFEQGPKRATEELALYLSSETAEGRLVVTDPRIAADQFFGMLMGFHHMEALLGVNKNPSETDWQPHIKRVVDVFVRAYGAH